MKPWENERLRKKLGKFTAQKTVKIFFDLYEAGLKILRSSLLNENPGLTPKQLKEKIDRLAGSIGKL